MNIDELTLAQVKQLQSIFQLPETSGGILQRYVGKYVICRSGIAGVLFGKVIAIDSTGVVLGQARRLWYHRPIEASWYEGVAKYGLHPDSKLSAAVDEKAVVGNYEINLVSDTALYSIIEAPEYK